MWWASLEIGYPYGDIVRLLLLTAQRREEVAGMRWEELDLEAGIWTIAASRNKSARLHAVPISSTAASILRRIEPVGPLVFPAYTDLAGERAFSGWSRSKRRLDEMSNVTEWRLHDLRRTAATGMARAGFPPFVVERVLNHATTTAGPLASVYQRYEYAEEKAEALLHWDREIVGLVRKGALIGHSAIAAE